MRFDYEAFHRDAVETPSHEGVAGMRALLVERLERAGYEPDVDEVGNVVVTRDASDDGLHLVLNTHLDTVPPHLPYERDGDIVRGRGACDAKGPLAAFVEAFCSASFDTGQLTLAVSPDEETSQFGGEYLGDTLAADGVIVGEPTGLDVCVAARGSFGGRVTVTGESAHVSEPASARNPISMVGAVVDALERFDEEHGLGEHEVLGEPLLTPTRIEGGGPLNQIPAECTVSFDRRSVPPETSDGFFATLQEYLVSEIPDVYEVAVRPAYPDSPDPEAFVTDRDTALVQTLQQASGGEIRAFGAATEASYFASMAPTVVFGPGVLADDDGPVAHSDREYVRLSEIAAAADAVQATVEELLA